MDLNLDFVGCEIGEGKEREEEDLFYKTIDFGLGLLLLM